MKRGKALTVQEWAKKEGIKLAAAYKRLAQHPDIYKSEKRYGRLVVIE